MPKPKFNDFSRYKNNELRNYFFKKELKTYLREREEIAKNVNPFVAPMFSAVVVMSLWIARSYLQNSSDDIFSILFLVLYYLKYAAIGGSTYIVIFLMFKKFINPLIHKVSQSIEEYRISKGVLDNEELLEKSRIDLDFLEKFNYEVVNQVSLALSLVSHTNESIEEPEKKFYTSESYQYLKKAMTTLEVDIINTEFVKKIKEEKYDILREHRVQETLELSKNILKKIETFWENEDKAYSHDVQTVRDAIFRIQVKLRN